MADQFEAIKTRRSNLENEIGAMIRNFESETGVRVSRISFTELQVWHEGSAAPSSGAGYRGCLIELTL